MDAAISNTSSRRGKKRGDIDLETMADAEIENMRKAMTDAAEADNTGRENGEPARHKLKLLPKVVALLNKNHLRESLVDPEINLLEAVRFFLEPLSDGSLPAYDIQKELFTALGKLPINKESLVASGIGKVIIFYIKSKRPEPSIKLQAERLFNDWTRPILGRTDDYRKKQVAQAEYDPSYVPTHAGACTMLTLHLGSFLFAVVGLIATNLPLQLVPRPWRLRVTSSAPVWNLAPRLIRLLQRAT